MSSQETRGDNITEMDDSDAAEQKLVQSQSITCDKDNTQTYKHIDSEFDEGSSEIQKEITEEFNAHSEASMSQDHDIKTGTAKETVILSNPSSNETNHVHPTDQLNLPDQPTPTNIEHLDQSDQSSTSKAVVGTKPTLKPQSEISTENSNILPETTHKNIHSEFQDHQKSEDLSDTEPKNPGESVEEKSAMAAASATTAVTGAASCSTKAEDNVDSSKFDKDRNIYQVKWIEFGLRQSAIITQNENGPCPLISVVNILLLRGKLTLPEGAEIVAAEQLLEYLADLILSFSASNADPDLECNINDAVAVLPKLNTGLDVNVKFSGVSEFEYTSEMLIFDILHINLYHGWLIDPQMKDLMSVVNSLSYNQLVEMIISNTGSEDSALYSGSLLAQQFLEESASQLTYHGLYELNRCVEEQELAVFFRNNHFSTLFKKNGELFLLVTDQGFLRQEDVVWETLSNIEGDSHFVNHNFQTTGVDPRVQGASTSHSASIMEQDLLLAQTLQREAEETERRETLFQQFKANHLGPDNQPLSDSELAARLQEAENEAAEAGRSTTAAAAGQVSVAPENPIGPRSGRKEKKDCVIL